MILVGDVGGTKTILALYDYKETEWVCYKKQLFNSGDFSNFEDLLNKFLINDVGVDIQNICIGVAGPVVNGDCVATNLPWVLKAKEIKVKVNAKAIQLLNDLEATAWGILKMPEQDFIELNPYAKEEKGNIAVVAAGTGLGEALLVFSDEKYHVVATEGGHTDFAPRNELEIGLLRYLMEMFPDHVSYERVVCGQGLVNIYDYLKSIAYAEVDEKIASKMIKQDQAAVISEAGSQGDKLCEKALKMFCEIYGAEAGNMALKCMSTGGVVLAGGIAAKILPSLKDSLFIDAYQAKGRYKPLLKNLSVKVCLNPEAGLLGAVNFIDEMIVRKVKSVV